MSDEPEENQEEAEDSAAFHASENVSPASDDTPETEEAASPPMESESDSAAVVAPNSVPIIHTSAGLTALVCGLFFGISGAALALQSVAGQVLLHIVRPDTPMDFQEVTEGLPVPRLLDWNVTQITALQFIAEPNILLLLLVGLLLCIGLLLCAASVLNPTFTLYSPESSGNRRHFSAVALEHAPVRKMFRALLFPGLFFALVWLVSGSFAGRIADFTGEIRMVALGIALWAGLHRRGIAGDYQNDELEPRRGWAADLILSGAGFGLVVYIASRVAMPGSLFNTLNQYQMLGTFHRGYMNFFVSRSVFCAAVVWSGAAILLTGLARPLKITARIGFLCVSGLLLFAGNIAQSPLRPANYARRLDITPETINAMPIPYVPRFSSTGVPEGIEAARELTKRIPAIPVTAPTSLPDHSILLFTPDGVVSIRQAGYTQDGLPLDKESLNAVSDFLKQRNYETSLSWTAIRHLFNVHLSEFDTTAAMSDLVEDMIHCPHLAQSNRTLETMLFTCAASPQNLAVLDRCADRQAFAFPDRESRRKMGSLYRRFGATAKALEWFQRAEMPKSFLKKMQADKPMFHAGRITGALRWNGKPLTGAIVAAQPFQMNGLPSWLADAILDHETALQTPVSQSSPLFAAYRPVPFAFRWVSAGAVTDANGNFAVENLIDGAYWLLIRLPDGKLLTPPLDSRLQIENAPSGISMNYDLPTKEVGTINMTFTP